MVAGITEGTARNILYCNATLSYRAALALADHLDSLSAETGAAASELRAYAAEHAAKITASGGIPGTRGHQFRSRKRGALTGDGASIPARSSLDDG